MNQRTFPLNEPVDFVIVGAGASGGVLARELSTNGFSVVVLEQGPWWRGTDFHHDELGVWMLGELTGSSQDFPQTFRTTESESATIQRPVGPLIYARGVGGSSVHFTANYWRFHPVDFKERSKWGTIAGTRFDDWPITYEELEPYYSRVDWEIGVSGAPGPFDPSRSRPYPMPPLPVKSSGVLLSRGAKKLGLHPQPAPMAILSRAHDGRVPCQHCGFCMGYGCEYGAKSSTLVSMIPKAVNTGRCEVRDNATVNRVEVNDAGRVTGVTYWDKAGAEQRQEARAVILSANGAETSRLLLMSASNRFPDGLANSSGMVGKCLMFNGNVSAWGTFPEQLNEYKSVQVTRIVHDFYDADPKRGFYGGGGFDGRFSFGPILFSLLALPPELQRWGTGFKQFMHDSYTRTMEVACHTTSLPLETNSISLDPEAKDKWGRPAIRVTYRDHDDDLKMMKFLQDKGIEVLDAAGATRSWAYPVVPQTIAAHLLGTCRMGTDPAGSVVNADHRTHDVPNLFICDGSSFVTSGRGQPTMTIQALAFRAADRITALARSHQM